MQQHSFFRILSPLFIDCLISLNCPLGKKKLLWFSSLQVIAIDHSGRLLDAALKIQQGKSLEITSALDKRFSSIPLNKIIAETEKVLFQQVRGYDC